MSSSRSGPRSSVAVRSRPAPASGRLVHRWRRHHCEWLATAIVPSIVGGIRPAPAPVSQRSAAAHEELIEYEVLASERLAARPSGVDEIGLDRAVVNTLAWAWKRTAGPPIDMHHADAG